MNKVQKICLAECCAALILASCATNERELAPLSPVYEEFYASVESPDTTKTYTDNQYRVLWNEDDRISIFNRDTYNQQYRFNGKTGDNSGSFSIIQSSDFITANPISAIYAIYPYAEGTKISNDEVLAVNLPSTQTWAQDSFGPGANVMVAAASDNKLMFKNAGGVLSFKLYGADASVSSLLLKSNGGEAISGKASIAMTVGGLPVLTMDGSASDEVTLSCPAPVTLNADASDFTEFWFVLPPVTFSSGFTITVSAPDGSTFTKSSTKALTISRNTISRMAPVEIELTGGTATQPDNEIWYTSTDGNIVEPYDQSHFDATIVSNTYADGKGIIAFDKVLKKVGVDAFRDCKTLKTVLLPESVESIERFAFVGASALCDIYIPQSVAYIGRFAFGRTSLVSVTLPDNYEYPADAMNIFQGCQSLESIYGGYASADHRCLIVDDELRSFAPAGLTEYTIPNGVKSITNYTFYYCDYLQKVTLPNTLQNMNHSAFYLCGSLETMEIPESMVSLTPGAICGCYSIESFSGKYATKDGRCLIDGDVLVAFAPYGSGVYDIPEGVREIGTLAFFYAFDLHTVTLPSTLTTIGNEAFEGSGLTCDLVIPASVTSMGTACLPRNLSSLTILTQTPPTGARYICNGDYTIYVPAASVEAYKSAQYWSTYANRIQAIPEEKQPDNEIWYTTTDGNIIVPNNTGVFGANIVSNTYANGKGIIRFDGDVTMIGDESLTSSNNAPFYNKSTLLTVQLPASVDKIGFCAFGGCRNLREIKLPEHLSFCGSSILDNSGISSLNFPETDIIQGNPVYNAGSLARFSGPYASSDGRLLVKDNTVLSFAPAGLTTYSIPEGITKIGTRGFSDSSELTSVVLPSSLTIIGSQSFVGCSSLKSIIIPEAVTEISVSAFSNCSGLESVNIPQGTHVSSGVFDQCRSLRSFSGRYASADGRCLIDGTRIIAFAPSGLTEYSIPDGITSVDYGFDGLVELESLTLPSSVSRIRFIRGSVLKTIYSLATDAPKVSYQWSLELPAIESIYVPAASVDTYKSAQYWSTYADRIQAVAAIPEAVDLGLPSGLKWASFNLGAAAPEGVGDFFAWGEILPKQYYGWDNYKWGTNKALTKYNSDSSLGTVDNLRELEASDDAANALLGGEWRMPTHSEQEELRNHCNWTVTTVNGVDGYLVSSKSNSNNIFLPITGSACGNEIIDTDEGYYWSSSLTTFSDDNSAAWFRLYLPGVSSTHAFYGSGRCNGLVIRPVCK